MSGSLFDASEASNDFDDLPGTFSSLDNIDIDSDDDLDDFFANPDDPNAEVESAIAAELPLPGSAPPTNHTFSTFEKAFEFAQEHAASAGYALWTRTSTQDRDDDGKKLGIYYGRVVCTHGEQPRQNAVAQENKLREKDSARFGCPFVLIISRVKKEKQGLFTITVKNNQHTCEPNTSDPTTYPTHRRKVRLALLDEMRNDRSGGLTAKDFYDSLMAKDSDYAVTYKDVKNDFAKLRDVQNRGYPAIQALLHQLDNDPEWLFDYSKDTLGRCERLVFIHKKSVRFLRLFPQSLILDGTFKTNQFNMTLINICGVTATNETVLLGQGFLSFLETDDYIWLMKYLKNLYIKLELRDPTSISSDKEQALVSAIEKVFPHTSHLLCVWHVNKCVEAYCLKYWRVEAGDSHGGQPLNYAMRQKFAQEKWVDFKAFWKKVVESKNESEFNTNWLALKHQYRDPAYAKVIKYLYRTWLIDRRKFVYAWTDVILHFGNAATNRVEGIHSAVKRKLKSRRGHLLEVIQHFQRYIIAHYNKLRSSLSYDKKHRSPRLLKNPLFARCHLVISRFAMKKVEEERARVNLRADDPEEATLTTCTGSMRRSMGLPCQHMIRNRMREGRPLDPTDFNEQWHVNRFAPLPDLDEFDLIRNPTTIPTRYPGTKRGRTAAEIQEREQTVIVAGRGRGRQREGNTHTNDADEVVDSTVAVLQRRQDVRLLGNLLTARTVTTRGKERAVEIPNDEDDELGPSYIEPRGISSLIEISDDSDNSEAGIGRVTASQAFETADLDDDDDDDDEAPPPPRRRRKDREKATAEDLASRVIYNIETGEATDAEDEIDHLREVEVEAQPAKKRRRFEDYLDD
jgi:hypothetical protein